MINLTTKNKVFIKTFGWPLVQVPHDDFRDNKEGKCLGVKELGYAGHNFRNQIYS